MLLKRIALPALALLTLAVPVVAQEDAIGIAGPISFEDTEFELAWTSNPSATYFKQEYLPAGEKVETYSQMFMVDVLTEGATPQSAVAEMLASLEARKPNDPVVNHAVMANEETGEIVLDFLMSDSSNQIVVEWNAYRYVPREEGLVLYAISRRGYGDQATGFLRDLGQWRMDTVTELATMELPAVALD